MNIQENQTKQGTQGQVDKKQGQDQGSQKGGTQGQPGQGQQGGPRSEQGSNR